MVPPALLPIEYLESSAMVAAYAGSTARLELLTPAELQVVELWPGRAPVAISCFEYLRTSIGAYGEVGVAWPVVRRTGARRAPPLLPLLLEARWPGLGYWVHTLPVTTDLALHAGRSIWGYPKLLASVEFAWQGSTRTCTLAEGGAEILRLAVDTRMPAVPRRFPLRTWSVLGDELLGTRIDVDAVGLSRTARARADLRLGPHPLGRELAELGLRLGRPVEVRWFPTWRARLFAAEERHRLAAAPGRTAAGTVRGAA